MAKQVVNRINNLQARQDKTENDLAKQFHKDDLQPNNVRVPIATGEIPQAREVTNREPAPWETRHKNEGENRTFYPRQRSAQRNGFNNGQRQRSRSNFRRQPSESRYGNNYADQDAPEKDLKYNPKAICRTCGQHGHMASGCNIGPRQQRTGQQIPVPVQPKEEAP